MTIFQFLAPDTVKLEANGDLSYFYKDDEVSMYHTCFLLYVYDV